MIQRVLQNRSAIQKISHLIPNYRLTGSVWKNLEELVSVLKPCYELTEELCYADLLPTDAYLEWMQTRYIIRDKKDGN